MTYFYSILTLLLFFPVQSLLAQSSELTAALSRFEQDEQMKHGITALCVLNAQTGEVIFERNGDVGMAPASTLKTITSVTAFNLLGPDYRYSTAVDYTGQLGADGILHGDIIIRGSGDPTLGSWRWPETREAEVLHGWVAAVKQSGIRQIEGRIIGDERRMSSQTLPGGWQWDDIGNYYGAGSGALNWRENQFDVLLEPSAAGGPVRMRGTRPEMDYLKFVNELQTGPAGTGDRAYVYLPPYREVAYLRGTYAIDEREQAISAAVPDPAFECAYRLRRALEAAGVPVSGEASTSRRLALEGTSPRPAAGNLTSFSSPSLSQLIVEFNDKSINLYGEALVKTLAIEGGKRGSTDAGIQIIRNFWAGKGIDSASLNICDGSGLSPANRVTVSTMARILLQARREPWFGDFYNSLPLQNGMRMKSGSIQGVRGYAGYHTSAAGRQYIFAFIVNNFNGSSAAVRRKMWSVLDLLK